jgi:nicotinamide phosphoribosyltransferase
MSESQKFTHPLLFNKEGELTPYKTEVEMLKALTALLSAEKTLNDMQNNLLFNTDSYKPSHWLQYPPNTTYTQSYLESRGGKYGRTVMFGLQPILTLLEKGITKENVEQAAQFYQLHGEPFNKEGWMYIVEKHGGKLPLKIRAVPEGMVVPTGNVLMTCENTDPNCYWLTSYFETMLMRVWYPITVATQSWHCKQIIKQFLDETADDTAAEILFKLHDFGSRGVSSRESAAIGGAAHLVNFMGSDTVDGVVFANNHYNCGMAGFSIPAAEHSTITTYGRDKEVDAYRNMLKQFAKPGALVAVVSDSYDIYNAVGNIWGKQLKDEVIASGATVIIRPDSGKPSEVVLKCLQLLDENFGTTYNRKGFKVLNYVRVIQGDGINEDSIREILQVAKNAGYSASNIAFGMGGALLQQVNRDTQRFAYKCSWAKIDGKDVEVFKDPVTDPGKTSKKGKLDLVRRTADGKLVTVSGSEQFGSIMRTVFLNGKVITKYTLDQVRKLAEEG